MSNILQDLMPVIYTTATGDADFNTAMGGRIYQGLAKDINGSPVDTYPYAVFSHVIDLKDFTYTSQISEVTFQWNIFDNTGRMAILQDADTKLEKIFDEVKLIIPNWNFIRISNENHIIMSEDVNGISISSTTYKVLSSKK